MSGSRQLGRVDLPYLNAVTSKGRTYHYYRREGIRVRLPGAPGSPEFMEAYRKADASFKATSGPQEARPGSFEALCRAFYASPEFAQLKPRTQAEYRRYLDALREIAGHLLITGITKGFVYRYRDKMAATPAVANHAVKALRRILSFAIKREWLRVNPAAEIEELRTGPGWLQWPEAAIERMEANGRGAARTAFMLALYTGQRKGDVLKMRWSDVRSGWIYVKQEKTGAVLEVPIHPALADELSRVRRDGLAIVQRRDGRPFTESGFNAMWKRLAEAAMNALATAGDKPSGKPPRGGGGNGA